MFLHLLEKNERKAFLGLANHLVQLDGISDEEESRLMTLLGAEAEVSGTSLDSEEIEELCGNFDSRRSKVSALLELVALGYVDDHFSAVESDFVSQLASCWELTPTTVEEVEDWVRRQFALVGEARELWEN